MSKAINAKTQNKGDRKKIASASHFVLFTTKDNTVEQWVALGRTLERILLRSTQMGIANAISISLMRKMILQKKW